MKWTLQMIIYELFVLIVWVHRGRDQLGYWCRLLDRYLQAEPGPVKSVLYLPLTLILQVVALLPLKRTGGLNLMCILEGTAATSAPILIRRSRVVRGSIVRRRSRWCFIYQHRSFTYLLEQLTCMSNMPSSLPVWQQLPRIVITTSDPILTDFT